MIATSTISLTGRFAHLLVERYREYLPVYGMHRAAFVTLDDVDAAARKAGYTEEQTGRITLDATRVLDMALSALLLATWRAVAGTHPVDPATLPSRDRHPSRALPRRWE